VVAVWLFLAGAALSVVGVLGLANGIMSSVE